MQEVFQVQQQPLRRPVRERAERPIVPQQEPQPQEELTREQYQNLLKTAQQMHKELAYLAMRMLTCTGIQQQEFLALTVEEVQTGEVQTSERIIHLPDSLREELLGYARCNGVSSGPIFISKAGTPMSTVTVRDQVKAVGKATGFEDGMVTAKALQNLFETTRTELMAQTTERLMLELLDREQAGHGWES